MNMLFRYIFVLLFCISCSETSPSQDESIIDNHIEHQNFPANFLKKQAWTLFEMNKDKKDFVLDTMWFEFKEKDSIYYGMMSIHLVIGEYFTPHKQSAILTYGINDTIIELNILEKEAINAWKTIYVDTLKLQFGDFFLPKLTIEDFNQDGYKDILVLCSTHSNMHATNSHGLWLYNFQNSKQFKRIKGFENIVNVEYSNGKIYSYAYAVCSQMSMGFEEYNFPNIDLQKTYGFSCCDTNGICEINITSYKNNKPYKQITKKNIPFEKAYLYAPLVYKEFLKEKLSSED